MFKALLRLHHYFNGKIPQKILKQKHTFFKSFIIKRILVLLQNVHRFTFNLQGLKIKIVESFPSNITS